MTHTSVPTKLPAPEFAVSMDEFAEMLKDIYIPGDIPVMGWSPPGWGKSASAPAVAASLGMQLVPVYGSAMQECDASGLPNFAVLENGDNITIYTLPELILKCRVGPTLILWDELPRASVSVLNSLLPAFSPERRLSWHKFPEDTRHIAFGNNCGSGNTTLPEAMEDRWNHIFLKVDYRQWLVWAATHGISPVVIAHIQHHPEALTETERKKTEKGHASPRQWESVSKLVEKFFDSVDAKGKYKYTKEQVRAMVNGSVGEGHSRQFVAFMDLLKDLEPIPYIISNPDKAGVPSEKSHLYVLVAALARYATLANWKNINVYLDRIPEEFRLLAVTSAVRRDTALLRTPEYIKHSVLSAGLVS